MRPNVCELSCGLSEPSATAYFRVYIRAGYLSPLGESIFGRLQIPAPHCAAPLHGNLFGEEAAKLDVGLFDMLEQPVEEGLGDGGDGHDGSAVFSELLA